MDDEEKENEAELERKRQRVAALMAEVAEMRRVASGSNLKMGGGATNTSMETITTLHHSHDSSSPPHDKASLKSSKKVSTLASVFSRHNI